MRIILTEKQMGQLKLQQLQEDPLYFFCQRSGGDSPYCELLELRKKEKNEEIINNFNKSFFVLLKFFYPKNSMRYNKSLFRDILTDFLKNDKERVFSFVDLLSDFISQEKFTNSKTKKALETLKNKKITSPDKLSEFLRNIRHIGYTEYEESFVGDHFELHKTKLELSYKCNDDLDATLYELIKKTQLENKHINFLVEEIKKCLEQNLLKFKNFVKADLKLNKDLYVIENDKKIQIFKSGDVFEVKKFDYEVDSYLSEFFSIFKSSKLSPMKQEILPTYNLIIDQIFKWISVKFPDFPKEVGKNMSGIIFDNNIIIPSKYLEYYWSNQGQRSCKELRLSIRFRVKPEFSQVDAFIYDYNSDILEKTKKDITKGDREKIICA